MVPKEPDLMIDGDEELPAAGPAASTETEAQRMHCILLISPGETAERAEVARSVKNGKLSRGDVSTSVSMVW